MDPRERWQALQSHLAASRQALIAGDTRRALEEANAALALDPDFTAARALRDRIDAIAHDQAFARPSVIHSPVPAQAGSAEPSPVRPAAAPPRPIVSTEGYARFEERAKRRRIERRTEAARQALASGKLREAQDAVAEIRALDPAHPDGVSLAQHIADARRFGRARLRRRIASRSVAVAAFATVLLAASLVGEPGRLLSHPISVLTALIPTTEPPLLRADMTVEQVSLEPVPPVPVAPEREREEVTPPPPRPAPFASRAVATAGFNSIPSGITPQPLMLPPPSTPAANTPPVVTASTTQPTVPEPEAAPALVATTTPPGPAPFSPPVTTVSRTTEPIANNPPKPADDALVRRTLLEYKNAYDALDAHSAQEVWPVVNARALARAFDGLESQRLIFDACDVQVSGDAATAKCRGSARYVAKVGSRDPRTEPRVWNFTLKRRGADWKIESARSDR